MKELIFFLFIFCLFFSCTEKKPVANPKELIDADLAFSYYSAKNGLQKAFIEFADDGYGKTEA